MVLQLWMSVAFVMVMVLQMAHVIVQGMYLIAQTSVEVILLLMIVEFVMVMDHHVLIQMYY